MSNKHHAHVLSLLTPEFEPGSSCSHVTQIVNAIDSEGKSSIILIFLDRSI